MNLSSQQKHYFKRELISLQIRQEIETLKQTSDLLSLRLLDDKGGSNMPFLRYLFQRVVVNFPLLKSGDEEKFWQKCQSFLEELRKSKQGSCIPQQADSQRKVLATRLENAAILALCANLRTQHGPEEGIKLPVMQNQHHEPRPQESGKQNALIINIVTVRSVFRRSGTLRRKDHAEFVIQTSGATFSESCVARRHGDFRRLREQLKGAFPTTAIPAVPFKANRTKSTLDSCREKDRVTLRAFLHRLSGNPKLANCNILLDFLRKDPITLTVEDKKDAEKRLVLDEARKNEAAAMQTEIDSKVAEMAEVLAELKKQVMQPGGIVKIFDAIKSTNELKDLPQPLKKAFEWGRISFAFALHKQFVTSEYAPENVASLERTHGLMPYRVLAGVLKISNPIAMMKYVMDLFLARPFGSQSLLQRMIASSMSEEIKGFQRNIDSLKESIADDILCEKIYNAVYTSRTTDVMSLTEDSTPVESILALLQNEDIEPALEPKQIMKVAYAQNSVQSQKLLKQLHKLWVLHAQVREQDTLMTLVFQGVTGELLKDLFAIFYQPLAQVYKAAGIGRSLTHVASFVDDLMELLESDSTELQRIQPFIDLVQKHEQRFYEFVHNVHSQDQSQLFNDLLLYMDTVFTFITRGLPEPYIDLDAVVESTGLSTCEHDALKDEIDALCEYRRQLKTQRYNKMRRKVGYSMEMEDADDEFTEFLPKNAEVLNALEDLKEFDYISDDEDAQDDSSNISSDSQSDESSSSDSLVTEIRVPKLVIIPKIVPVFVQDVSKKLI